MTLSQSPLHATHAARGARFVDFAGWAMPLQYQGVVAEHVAVRDSVGVFDVSHLGRFRVEGPGATELLRRQLCNDITRVGPGRAQYTMALDDAGGIEDDIIVWRLDDESYWVLPNGANFDEIIDRFAADAPPGIEVEALRASTALLAVQGPGSVAVVEGVLGTMPGRFRVVSGKYRGRSFWAAGTGYTGERGAEIAVPAATADHLFDALLEGGATPCGLGARDTLRLEMGYPLWGQDLDESTTPLEAGLEWVVDWNHDFVGRDALVAQREDGVERTLVGFRLEGRRVPRTGYRVRSGAAEGTVTSGNYSPVLGCGIGLAYIAPPTPGDIVEVEVRGEWVPGTLVEPPFIDR